MTVLSSTFTYTIGAGATATASTSVTVAALAASVTGRGRLVHPTLGTYDYPYSPDYWSNFDTDVIVPPEWAHTKTLTSGQNTLWQGNIRDVEVSERWQTADLAAPLSHLRMLISMWTTPPDPTVLGYVQWSPTYTNGHTYNVVISDVSVNGNGINLDKRSRLVGPSGRQWVNGEINMRMRIVNRII
jgi:hypothetical protein